MKFALLQLCLLPIVLASCAREVAPVAPHAPAAYLTVQPDVPLDVAGGAEHADLAHASQFAWQQFIALNWPARHEVRDTADRQRKFGELGGPVVWETLRSKVEIYPGNGDADHGPHGWDSGLKDDGYDQAPSYVYKSEVPPCDAAAAALPTAAVNLDEVSQVGFDHLFAGTLGDDDTKQIIRYTSKANRVHYTYVVAHKYWYAFRDPAHVKLSPYEIAGKNFTDAVTANHFPIEREHVQFPIGSIEVKAAFRPLTAQEEASGRFHMARVRYYEKGAGGEACFAQGVWGLLALHIIQKTATAPAFTWATFEQADNLQTEINHQYTAVEDDDGKVVHGRPSTTPPLRYQDGPYVPMQSPLVSKQGPFCSDPGGRLYYREIAALDGAGKPVPNTPVGGRICVEGRMRPLPRAVIDANRAAHRAMSDYERTNRLPPSPWQHYKLVNIQTYPFDKSQISPDESSGRGASTYYLANIVVETDYTLQNHSGGPETKTGFAPSDLTANFTMFPQPPAAPQFQSAYVFNHDGSLRARYNMGGCLGCHGLTQVAAGSDYSYLLSGSTVAAPEFPETPDTTLVRRYIQAAVH
ncbi:MAG: hypothetical protein JWN02_2165 [Acidobacteria bacterium]|nr:hypothetical protein [Acidobacteriota bacterium]